jgi:tetratricopeptide (TPR) repeat protein
MVEEKFFPEGPHLIPAVCSQCGALVSVTEGGHIKCGYCGSEFYTKGIFKTVAGGIKNYYELAYNAQERGDFEKAYDHFSKVLEIAPTEYLAWFGKGTAAGYLSSSREIRSFDVIYCFEKALEYTPEEDIEDMEMTLGVTAGEIGKEMLDWLIENKLTSTETLGQILELLKYWDSQDPENEDCWKWLVNLGVTPVRRMDRDIYPYSGVAKEYSEKIRERFDPEFKNRLETTPTISSLRFILWLIFIIVFTALIIYLVDRCG